MLRIVSFVHFLEGSHNLLSKFTDLYDPEFFWPHVVASLVAKHGCMAAPSSMTKSPPRLPHLHVREENKCHGSKFYLE